MLLQNLHFRHNNLDPNSGYPTGVSAGIHTSGLFAENDVAVGKVGGNKGAVHIEAVGDVTLNSINVKLSNMVQLRMTAASGDYVRNPTCLAGQSPHLQVSVEDAAANTTGLPMTAFRVDPVSVSGTYWRVYLYGVPLKIRDFGFWVGGNGRGTGVYMPIHEDSEVIPNTARKQKINF